MNASLLAILTLAPFAGQKDDWPESDYYAVDYLPTPAGARVEVGGMAFLPDGRLALSTRRGQVWMVANPLAADPAEVQVSLFAEGLQEGLGMAVVDGELVVLQRAELSRLRDEDGDGRCDRVDTIANDWGVSGHYHEFAFGLPRDADGNFYVSLNVSFGDPEWWHGRSTAPYRGWVMRIARDGSVHPFAPGFRSPAGLGMSAEGQLLVTENQGDWMAACPIFHVQEGRFYGHPAALDWSEEYRRANRRASDTVPPERERASAAVWIPYDWSRSTGSLAPDESGGKFGPFERQLFVAEMTNGKVLRAQLEEVGGELQGSVFPFRSQVGSAVRVLFAPDGTLFCGFTDRGWGGQAPGDGVARIRWTGRVPMEMRTVRLQGDGFEIEFTKPLAAGCEIAPEQVHLQQYDYDYWWEYGSPLRNLTQQGPAAVEVSADRRRLTLRFRALQAGMVARLKLDLVFAEGGEPLLHDEMAYTVNRLPSAPEKAVHVAKTAQPPMPRESGDEGVLMLAHDEPLEVWTGAGWSAGAGGVELDPADPARLVRSQPKEGDELRHRGRVLSNVGAEAPQNLVSRFEFGDVDFSGEFLLPEDGNSGVYAMGRYELQLRDSAGKKALDFGDCGGIYESEDGSFPGSAPAFDAFRGPGEWHDFSARFQAPRFDERGRKVANAKFLRVLIDDVLMQEEVEVSAPTRGAMLPGEAPSGPLVLQGDHGPVAFRHVIARLRNPGQQPGRLLDGWKPLFDGRTTAGWTAHGGSWKVENGEIVGSGAGHLYSPRGDYRDFELRARCKVNDGGDGGLFFRAGMDPKWPQGYEVQVDQTAENRAKTGTLCHLDEIRTQLVLPDVWFTLSVSCRDEEGGVRIATRLNDVLMSDVLDRERRCGPGHVALQTWGEKSVVRWKDLEIRESSL